MDGASGGVLGYWGATWGAAASVQLIVTSVLGGFQKYFVLPGCSLRGSHLEIWHIISFRLRIWQSRSLCLGVACGVQVGFFGRSWCVTRAQKLGSTVDTCSASVAALLDEWHLISFGEVDSDPEVVFLRSLAEVCSVDASVFTPFAQRPLEIWTVFLELHEAEMMESIFRRIFTALLGLLFGIEDQRFRVCQLISMNCGHAHPISEHASETTTTTPQATARQRVAFFPV